MIYGYARVLRDPQERALVTTMLEQAGAETVLLDYRQVKARYSARSRLRYIESQVAAGDGLVIPDISHLHRRVSGMLTELDTFLQKGVRVRSLWDSWLDKDEPTQQGKEIIHSLVLHEQRQIALHNQWVAEAYGREPGQRIAFPPDVRRQVIAMRENGAGFAEIRRDTGVSRSTASRYIREDKERKGAAGGSRPKGQRRQAYPPEVVAKVITMRKSGFSYEEIERATGMTRNTVNRYMRIDKEKEGGDDGEETEQDAHGGRGPGTDGPGRQGV